MRTEFRFCLLLASLVTLTAGSFLARGDAAHKFSPAEIPGVHNAFRVSDKVMTGSAPEYDAAFKALKAAGVKTIITVDGTRPDVETAQKYGLRYVQIPFGYDGLPRDKALTLARAVRDLPGKFYIHCHHGKHRSPVAAACVAIANDGWSNDDALAFLKSAGTGDIYTGLWDSVRNFKKPTAEEIVKTSNRFPAIAPTVPLVQTMVKLDQGLERLRAAWDKTAKPTARHPDLEVRHEAMMMRELFVELQRDEKMKSRPADFRAWLAQGETSAAALEDALRAADKTKADTAFGKITEPCASCHTVYRNVPQKADTRQP